MILLPFDKIAEIDTGNPYTGLTSISSGEKFLDIASKFPNHRVFVKSRTSPFPTSILKDGTLHVYYNGNGCVVGLELMVPELIRNGQFLNWRETNILPEKMERIVDISNSFNIGVRNTGYGLEVPDIGASFYASDFDDSLQGAVDSVYIQLKITD